MSKFENERYNVFLRNISNKEYLKINASSKQENALKEIYQYERNHVLFDVSVLNLIEDFLNNNRNISEELINDLVSKTIFHVGGDYNYLFKSLTEKYLKK